MNINPILLMSAVAGALALPASIGNAGAPSLDEKSKNIIAVQIRRQGFACTSPQKAERDKTIGNPDDPIWTLTCENAVYRVHLIPNQAAKVERLVSEQKSDQP